MQARAEHFDFFRIGFLVLQRFTLFSR